MKRILMAGVIAIALPTMAVAQEQLEDSVMTQKLEEVVIQAPKIIRKADMDVLYPSASAVKNAQNGMQLLRNLMIPTLTVNDAMGTITAAGESVQVRINGREATVDQVRALLPETIKRVEWMDNPGLRYGNASNVINFIVVNPTVGGSLMTSIQPALNQKFGFYMADAKFNSGRSQWQVGGNLKLTEDLDVHRDYNEKFAYADGTSLTRTETPLGGKVNNSFGYLGASYSYIKPDTTILYIAASASSNLDNLVEYDGKLSLSDGSDNIYLTDSSGDKGATPSLSAYLEQHFRNKQTLVVNMTGSYYMGKSFSDYMEQQEGATSYLNDIHTMIKDRNQAYSLESNYIKNWSSSRVTAGASYTANRNRSLYENLDGEIFHQKQDKVYLFAEYYQRLKKVTITAGMGTQYTEFLFKETNQGSSSWNLRPRATVTYALNQKHNFRLSFTSWQTAPSLTQTNITPQQIDGFQWRVGNPDLKTENAYKLNLRYGFNSSRISGTVNISGYSSPNAIAPLLKWEDERLITTYENSKGQKILTFSVAPQIEIIPEWLTLSGDIAYRIEETKGTGYRHTNRNLSGDANLQLTHWGFVLTGVYSHAARRLDGETITWGEDMNVIDLSYNRKSWYFGAGVIMPFGEYDQGSKQLNKLNTNESHSRLDMRIPYIKVSYNLHWGHQKRGANRLINADAAADKSSARGR